MPLPLLPIAIGAQALSTIWGAHGQNKANEANRRMQQQQYDQLLGLIMPRLGQQAGSAEQGLLEMLTGGAGKGNQAFNTGQDSLTQMLNKDPFDTSGLFASWEPIEHRALEQALGTGRSQASGLGQRFGSAQMRMDNQTRETSGQSSAARRQEANMQVHDQDANRKMQIAQILGQLGLGQEGMMQGLAGIQNQRMGMDTQLLSLLSGQHGPMAQPGAGAGALGDIGQLMAMLPFLQQLSQPKVD